MMKKIHIFLTLLIFTLQFFGCKDNVYNIEDSIETNEELSITLTASIPSDTGTRIALTKIDNNIALSWEEGDVIELAFVQGDLKVKQTVEVKDITEGGKKAQFNIVIPNEITGGTYDLYGVFGGKGLDATNPTQALVSESLDDAGTLEQIQMSRDLMLYFKSTGIDYSNPNIVVSFKHIGSIFSVLLENTGDVAIENIIEANLIGQTDGNEDWAYDSNVGGIKFDLVNESFVTTTGSTGNFITIKPSSTTLVPGETLEFWGWYPPFPDKIWPELKLQLIYGSGVDILSVNSKPARTVPTDAGKAYYFRTVFDGSVLSFSDEPIEEGPAGDLLFPGSDFEDWDAFINNNDPSALANNPMLVQSPLGTGVDGGHALSIKGPVITGNNPILLRFAAPTDFSLEGKTKIVFYMKGTAGLGGGSTRCPVINWFKPNGVNYYAFGLIKTYAEDRVIESIGSWVGDDENKSGSNPYTGVIDTEGNWVKIELKIADLPHGIGNTSDSGHYFAIRFPSSPHEFDLMFDNFTIE